jgi:hypothetical protein
MSKGEREKRRRWDRASQVSQRLGRSNQRTSGRLSDQPRFNFRGHGVWGEEETMGGTLARMQRTSDECASEIQALARSRMLFLSTMPDAGGKVPASQGSR